MLIGVPKESAEGERRVALVPEVVKKLTDQGHEVLVERGAGEGALIPDGQYEEAGAKLVGSGADAFGADLVVKVAPPNDDEVSLLRPETTLIAFLQPLTNGPGIDAIAASGATSFAMEAVPRISRAQSMDALSSQANIAGYRAALIGALELG
ncbi:MAG TPA: NAD(P)(+) transhydrogenase (Re/Si-specific) subunit alpha, partial [Solirubrobacteraceae bacterium]|nr:NAD(P)(+) transhydrogenase (Re/Si-specific) subunit alpha [Solirubrobacteraceae bacterium]